MTPLPRSARTWISSATFRMLGRFRLSRRLPKTISKFSSIFANEPPLQEKKSPPNFSLQLRRSSKIAIGGMRLISSRQGNRGSTVNRKEDGQRIRLYQENCRYG